jgi:hypothetical protein
MLGWFVGLLFGCEVVVEEMEVARSLDFYEVSEGEANESTEQQFAVFPSVKVNHGRW